MEETSGDRAMREGAAFHAMHGMVFQLSKETDLLFPFLATQRIGYLAQLVICFFAGVIAVVLKVLRNRLEVQLVHKTTAGRNTCRALAMSVVLIWDYFLMLGAMTLNVGVFCAIISGVAAGFFILGDHIAAPIPPPPPVVCRPSPVSTSFYASPHASEATTALPQEEDAPRVKYYWTGAGPEPNSCCGVG